MPLPARAAVRQAEVLDVAVLHEHHLDVLPADVADHVDRREPALGAHHVRDGLDDVRVGAERALEHVAGVAGDAEAGDLERRALVGRPLPHLGEHVLHVLDRVALRERVDLLEDVLVLVDEHALRRRRAAVEADHAAVGLAGLERRVLVVGRLVLLGERDRLLRRPRRGPGRPLSPSLLLRPWLMNSSSGSRPRYAPTVSGS